MRGFKLFMMVVGILCFFQGNAQTDALTYADSLSKATGITYMNMFGTQVFVPKPGKNSAIKKNINVIEIFSDSMQVIAEIKVLQMPAYALVQQTENESIPFSIYGHTGKLYKKSSAVATVLSFLFEDDEARILIEVSFTDVGNESYYTDLLKKVRYDKKVKIHTRLLPFLARFTVDAAGAGYALVDISKGAYRYASKGLTPKSVSDPQMWITEHNSANISELRYLDLPALPAGVIADSVVKNMDEPTIDGFKVYTLLMYIGVSPNRLMVYQTVRTNGMVSAVFTATATSDFEKNRVLFTKMANSVRVRGTDEIKMIEK